MPDPILGERMCAYVILHRGHSLDLSELFVFLMHQEIATHKLPERLEIVAELPLSQFGKVSKKDLTNRITQLLKSEGRYL